MVQVQIGVKITYDEKSAFSDVWGIVEDWRNAMRWKWASTAYTQQGVDNGLNIKDCQD